MAAAATDKFIKGVRRFSTTLASPGIANDTVQTATLDSAVNLPTDTACVLTFDRVDSDGALTPAKEESVVGVISGSDITNMVRGFEGTAQAHAAGAVVEVRYLAAQHNRLIDGLLVEHNNDGTHKDITADSINLKSTYTDAGNVFNSSLSRQAIINGNFDVWQRGTSVAVVDITNAFLADRWFDYTTKDGGTLPTLTRSRQILTSGNIPNAFYFSRLTTNGAGTSLGVNSMHAYRQYIEHGTRLLCGLNKRVTVSFWAKSDIANKKIGVYLFQSYGTGGTPTTGENITGEAWTLTSTWTKYTYTFTTNTLVGKTFGTANDDHLRVLIGHMWGSTAATNYGESTSETYVGAGNIDIAQVQLCAGDVALPFQPKSFEEELRACQRYYEKSYAYTIAPGTATLNGSIAKFSFSAGGSWSDHVSYRTVKRTTPGTVTIYSTNSGTAAKVYAFSGVAADVAATVSESVDSGFNVSATLGSTNTVGYYHWTADAEL